MEVIKIGGAVLRSKSGFEAMASIMKLYDNKQVLVVISAFSKTTYLLKLAAQTAEHGKIDAANIIIDKIIEEHTNLINDIIISKITINQLNNYLTKISDKVKSLLRGVSITSELTPRTLDLILSFGELLALVITKNYLLNLKLNILCIDSMDVIVTDSNYGSANPILEVTKKNIEDKIIPFIHEHNIILTQGFTAQDENGEVTTMGIESSNLTATIYAELMEAESITIWTDVEGFRTADPKIVTATKPVKHLNWNDAFIAAANGLKLLYPTMINSLRNKNINIYYKSAFSVNGAWTVIDNRIPKNNIPLIISKSNLNIIKFTFESEETRIKILEIIINNQITNNLFQVYYAPDSIYFITQLNSKKLVLPDFVTYEILSNYTAISVINIDNEKHQKINEIINSNDIQDEIFKAEYDYITYTYRILIKDDMEKIVSELIHDVIF